MASSPGFARSSCDIFRQKIHNFNRDFFFEFRDVNIILLSKFTSRRIISLACCYVVEAFSGVCMRSIQTKRLIKML